MKLVWSTTTAVNPCWYQEIYSLGARRRSCVGRWACNRPEDVVYRSSTFYDDSTAAVALHGVRQQPIGIMEGVLGMRLMLDVVHASLLRHLLRTQNSHRNNTRDA